MKVRFTCLIWVVVLFGGLGFGGKGWGQATGKLQFIHNSPDDSLEMIGVTIVSGSGFFHYRDNHPYLFGTDFLVMGTGPVTITIASDTGGTNVITYHTQTFYLGAGDVKIAILNGIYDTAAYPGLDTLRIDVVNGKEYASNFNDNDILVHNGALNAPALNFTTVANTPIPLGNALSFGNFATGYVPVTSNDTIIKVHDASLVELNRTYQYLFAPGEAGVIFSSGFVHPPNADDPEFQLYYAHGTVGMAIPLIELRNDAPIWVQELNSTRVWFGEVDTFACANHTYQWTFYDTNLVSIGTVSGCNATFLFPDIGMYSAIVFVDNDTFQMNVEVVCPEYKIQFDVSQTSPDTVCIINQSVAGPNWLPAWLPTTWQWIVGTDTSNLFSPCFGISIDTCDLIQLSVTATIGCGTTATERMLIMEGYVPDKPLRSQHWTCSPGHTPITWEIPYNWGERDLDHNRIDNHLVFTQGYADILVYYKVPEGCMHENIKDAFQYFHPNVMGASGTFDRISKYLTVASYRHVNQQFIDCLLSQPACSCSTNVPLPISLITSDNPVPANHSISGNLKSALSGSEILDLLRLNADVFAEGNGVGIGIIGAGAGAHVAFSHLPNHKCVPNPQSTDHNYENYLSFVGTGSVDCNFGTNFTDLQGDGTSKSSLLAATVPEQNKGICPKSNFYFLDVADQQPDNNFENMVRKSDILEAFDWAIYNKSSSVPISILVCDFSFGEVVDSNDAIAVMANIASSYGMAVFASLGMAINGLGTPGNASQVITIAGAFLNQDGTASSVSANLQGNGYGSPSNDPTYFKPDLTSLVNAMGANLPNTTDSNRRLLNLEIPAFMVAGLASLILEIRPDLNLEKLKLLITKSAESNLLNVPSTEQGYGIINPATLENHLRERKCDLGFSDWYGMEDCISHQSSDIITGLPNKTYGNTPILAKDQEVTIRVRVTNNGGAYDPDANPGSVSLRLHCFSNQTLHPYDLAYIEKPLRQQLAINETVEIEFKYKAPVPMDVFCIEASINCICDCNPHNDIAKRNDYRICVDANSPFFFGKRKVYGPYDADSIVEKVIETPPNSGYKFFSGFRSGVFSGDEFPLHTTDTINYDPLAAVHVPGTTFCVTSYAVFGNDSIYNGGVTYTICDGVPLGIPLPPPTPTIKIYPVPASENVTVRIDPATTGPGSIELYTLLGQLIERREMKWQKGVTKEEVFTLDDLPGGVYLFRISIGGQATFKKFVKI